MSSIALGVDVSSKTTDNGNQPSAGAVWPEYPGHNATKLELKVWFNQFRADLTSVGFGCTLRKETPREAIKLQDRSLIAVPTEPTAAAAITVENAKIEHQNKLNAIERLSIENEYKSRLASRLHTATTLRVVTSAVA